MPYPCPGPGGVTLPERGGAEIICYSDTPVEVISVQTPSILPLVETVQENPVILWLYSLDRITAPMLS